VTRVAALFVEDGGSYYGIPEVDPWPESKDARLYAGPHPVVAHPPCQMWINYAALNFKRYGGEHNRPGNDGGCFESALASVRRWGGVLEHPASSNAWAAHGLPRPTSLFGWCGPYLVPGGGRKRQWEWTCEVWQSAYGHRARKRTWLLWSSPTWRVPPQLNWQKAPGTHQIGWFDRAKPTLGKKAASATPPEFREALLGLARAAVPAPVAK
jgi:hypothetical protein